MGEFYLVFIFFPVFVHLREEGFHSFSLVVSSTGFSTLIMDEIKKKAKVKKKESES